MERLLPWGMIGPGREEQSMSRRARRNHPAAFKARVTLAALKGDHPLPSSRQAEALGVNRGSVYYLPRPTRPADLALKRRIDELHLETRSLAPACCATCCARRGGGSAASTSRR